MAVVVVAVLVMLPLLVFGQNQHILINTVVIPGDGANSCPSPDTMKSARQRLSERVLSELSKILENNKEEITNDFKVNECGEGVWHNLVSINMLDPLSQCPDGWVEENVEGVRACGRGSVGGSCKSAIFSNDDYEYTKVCGRAIGYQYGHTDAFHADLSSIVIDGVYLDGLSITYGSPRQHLWTFTSGLAEIPINTIPYSDYTTSNCPCSNYPGRSPPSFVGNNWYCESGNPESTIPYYSLLSNDPLWDGEDCEGSCCSNGKTPPWFSVQLPTSTNEDIEARICGNEYSDTYEDVFIKIVEIFVQ